MQKIMVTRSSMPTEDEYFNEIKSIWETHWLTNMGEKHQELENKLKSYLEVPRISLMSNGHMALELTLQAMGLQGEVITTPFTFASTTHAIVRNGLEPVFCDINENNYTIDTTKMERLITDKTCAIVPVHVYGNICDVDEIQRIAEKYSLKVVYDAAHAFGVTYRGKGIASYGDASIFSFHATKVFNTIEGGAVCFKDKDLERKLYQLKNFGIRNAEEVDAVGTNAKMNEFQAAMGICNLRHVDENIEKRKLVFQKYTQRLSEISGIRLLVHQENVRSNCAYFPVIIDEKKFGTTRNEVFDVLEKKGIFTRKYFYPLTSSFECFHGKYDVNRTPEAIYISKRVLTLPMYAELALEDVDWICDEIIRLGE